MRDLSRGVLPEIGWFSSTREESAEKGAPPRSCCVADLALCLRSLAASKYEGRETPSESPLLMKTSRFLAGLPSFSASEAHRGVPLARASEPSDTYAWAVMSVGPDALLYGESVIAMFGLALINPTRMFVATPRRTRRKLPDSVKAEWVRSIRPTAAYNGPLPKRARCHLRMRRQNTARSLGSCSADSARARPN